MRTLPIFLLAFLAFSCNKNPADGNSDKLSYGDSVFYLKNTSYTISPKNKRQGTYAAFPDNLKINPSTGVITIGLNGNDGQSQTGLRYKIKFTSADGQTDSSYIVIAGITYVDKFYYLSQNQNTIRPVYNADLSKGTIAGNYSADDNDLAINSSTGEINIQQTISNGFFNNQINTSWKEVTIDYRTSDNSGVNNSIDIILYYYNTINDIPRNVAELMQAHQRMNLGIEGSPIPSTPAPVDNNLDSDLSLFKPRPPCIVIVGH